MVLVGAGNAAAQTGGWLDRPRTRSTTGIAVYNKHGVLVGNHCTT